MRRQQPRPGPRRPCLQRPAAAPAALRSGKTATAIATCPADTALIISTSGSEGQPRQVLLGARQLDSAARAANACLHLEAGDRWLNCLPLYHIGGQSILWRCARAAACVVLHDGFVAEAVARDLDACSITHLSLVPAMLARLLDLGCRPPPTLRAVLIGGAALSRPLYDRATAAGWPLHVSYGMSETAAQVATFTPNDGLWHEGLVGRPCLGTRFVSATMAASVSAARRSCSAISTAADSMPRAG
jgi:O-succinylbenzoic acid--CoA ligase